VIRVETGTTRSFRFGLMALTFSIALGFGDISLARAQYDNPQAETATAPATDQPDQNAVLSPEEQEKADAAQQAHDAADAAQDALDSATEARDQLESDGAAQDQIDAANAAIAQARAAKDAADAAVQGADGQ